MNSRQEERKEGSKLFKETLKKDRSKVLLLPKKNPRRNLRNNVKQNTFRIVKIKFHKY